MIIEYILPQSLASDIASGFVANSVFILISWSCEPVAAVVPSHGGSM